MSWTREVFLPKHFDKLNGIPDRNRGDGFLTIFTELELIPVSSYTIIIETGTMRPGFTEEGDGQSTQLFDSFVNYYSGEVLSIDVDPSTSNFARTKVSDKTKFACYDSVKFLWKKLKDVIGDYQVSLFYLDSYDVDFSNPIAANLHHIKELVAISRYLKPGTLVAVDDCRFEQNDPRVPAGVDSRLVGKGTFVQSFMDDIGANLVFDGYQKVWRI